MSSMIVYPYHQKSQSTGRTRHIFQYENSMQKEKEEKEKNAKNNQRGAVILVEEHS